MNVLLMAENENHLQNMLTCADDWCKRWCLSISKKGLSLENPIGKGVNIASYMNIFEYQ